MKYKREKSIFVSYSSGGEGLARELTESLLARGYNTYFAEHSLPFGEDIKSVIQQQISDSGFFVLVHSRLAEQSEWVRFEVDCFLELEKKKSSKMILVRTGDALTLPALIGRRYITAQKGNVRHITPMLLAIENSSWRSALLTREEIRREVCFIPRGMVYVGPNNTKTKVEYDFLIDKYPVTRRKFMSFCYFGGYQNLLNYDCRGRLFMESARGDLLTLGPEDLLQRRFPLDVDRMDWIDYPMIRLSAYEAAAYTRWVGGRLPLEREFDRAGRADNPWAYPWGPEYDPERCFTGKWLRFDAYSYSDGQSPFGVFNLAGNKEEFIGELYRDQPTDLADDITTRGWLDYVHGAGRTDKESAAVGLNVPPYSLLGRAGCFPVAAEGHMIGFRTVYPLDSPYDQLV